MKNNISRNEILTYITNELISTHQFMEKCCRKGWENSNLKTYTKGRIAQLELIWFDLTGEWLKDQYPEVTTDEE